MSKLTPATKATKIKCVRAEACNRATVLAIMDTVCQTIKLQNATNKRPHFKQVAFNQFGMMS